MEVRQGNVIINVDETKLSAEAKEMIEFSAALLADVAHRDDWKTALPLFKTYLSVLISKWRKPKGWSTD